MRSFSDLNKISILCQIIRDIKQKNIPTLPTYVNYESCIPNYSELTANICKSLKSEIFKYVIIIIFTNNLLKSYNIIPTKN